MNTKKIVIRRAAAATGACAIGLALTACQANGQSVAGGTPDAASPSVSAPDTALASSTPATPNATATAPSSAAAGGGGGGLSPNITIPACSGSQIHVSTGDGGAGMSHAGIVLIFTNSSTQSCSLTGYAGAALTFSDGHRVNASRAMDSYLGGDSVDTSPLTVTLNPGDTASDLLAWTTIAAAGSACQGDGSTSLLVTTPGTTDTQVLTNGESQACGNFNITPVVPGTTGSKQS